ncbi:MAG: fructosamine kinase family protein, partial [Longimicrobiales bacterium]
MTGLPRAVIGEVEEALARLGNAGPIRSARPLGGGCISPCVRIEEATGTPFFVKWAQPGSTAADFFAQEARSLDALRAAGSIRVPRVHGVGDAWLLLEWLEPGHATVEGWTTFGSALAEQHRHIEGRFGWAADNYIGSLPQANQPAPIWGAFWRDRRLLPQLTRATASGALSPVERARFDRLLDRLDDLLQPGDAEGASLLHGDLWSGNVHFLANGEAAVIDPSTYRGHREVDLAMAALFGGFPRAFFDAYAWTWPLCDGAE